MAEVCAMARAVGAVSLVDGAQSLPHFKVDFQKLECDFFTFGNIKFLPLQVLVHFMEGVIYLIGCLLARGAEA